MRAERPRSSIRKALSLALLAILGSLPVAVPFLDRDPLREHPVLEAQHDGTCVHAHDHTLCTAFGAQRWATRIRPLPHTPAVYAALALTRNHVWVITHYDLSSAHPRAPPQA